MKIVHFGDLHLRHLRELLPFEQQLARALAEGPDHVVISGDLVDRWDPPLFRAMRDLFSTRGLLDPDRLTIIHGNHDLASSGGWPRSRADIPRLVLRFWDPPPLLAWRRAGFVRRFSPVAASMPYERVLPSGIRLLAIDSTPLQWLPFSVGRDVIRLRTALGTLRSSDWRWLDARAAAPSVLLVHHSPLRTEPLQWNGGRVLVPMHVEGLSDRFWDTLERIGVRLVLCGHVHRTVVEARGRIAVAVQGQSGAVWAGQPFSVYETAPDATLRTWVTKPVPPGSASAAPLA